MECQDVRLLLTFAHRTCEEVGDAERAALQQHLDKCPDCTALAQADRHADQTLGRLMLDVPIPADLKQNVLARLAKERPRTSYKPMAAAAALLLAISAASAWYLTSPSSVSMNDVRLLANLGTGWDESQAQSYFDDQGLYVRVPSQFDYMFLRRVEIVEFKNRRVAKLSFRTEFGNGTTAHADVLILPHRQFAVDDLPAQDFDDVTNIRIIHDEAYSYLILYRGQLNELFRALR